MRQITLQEHEGMIVIQEVQRDYSKPEEVIYRWPTAISAKDWRDNWNGESLGKPAYPYGNGQYGITGMMPRLALQNGANTHCLPVETRDIPKPKRVKEPFYRDGFWRNRRGEIC